MNMWNEYDLDLCEVKTIVTDDNELNRVTATEYYLENVMIRRDVHLEIKQGLSTASMIGA